ncbi:MAG: insulinase family protein [Leptospirales bacterium]
MNYKIGDTAYNFTLETEYTSEELACKIQIFSHEKLKNNLIAIQNDDPNKCFCVGFKTPPADSTGVPHILEHSVLSGSQKYPIKDVFSELIKGSLTTFLNAMTYSDKTLYPFSTRNEKEFFNLMDVYLDLTLNPSLEEDTFMQEGWHYKISDPDSSLKYNGIVLNEMKGVFSDPVRKMWEKITTHLLPDSTYANCSGGDPENIPDLTYENFVAFHKRYYHPANSHIVVYGDIPLERTLKKIDEDFFSKVNYVDSDAKINKGKKMDGAIEISETYQTGEGGEPLEYLSMGIETGEINTVEHNIAMEILTNLLFNSEASLLKIDLLKAGAGSEIGCFYNDTFLSFLFIYIIGANEKSGQILKETYANTLKVLIKEGIPQDLILSEINSYDFHKRELTTSAKRGMDFTLEAMSSLMYGLDIVNSLETTRILDKIREEALNNRYFEKLIEQILLNNDNTVLYSMSPGEDKSGAQDAESKKLVEIKESLSENEVAEFINKAAALEKKQQEPSPEDKIKLLPKLKLSDITPEFEKLALRESSIEGVKTIITENRTSGINHLNIGFETKHIEPELLSYLSIFGQIITEIGTKKRDYVELAKFTNTYTGGLASDFTSYSKKGDATSYTPMLWFHMKFLDQYEEQAFDLLDDILTDADFTNKTRLAEIIDRSYSALQYNITSEGYFIPVNRVSAYISERGMYNELVDGYSSFQEISKWKGKKGDDLDGFIDIMNRLAKEIVNRKKALVHFTCEPARTNAVEKKIQATLQKLPEADFTDVKIILPVLTTNQAFSTPADVVYAVLGGNIIESGIPYSGKLEVLRKFIDRDYLYNQIRVLGGAYGNFSRLNRFNGNLIYISYRDPNIKSTFEAFYGIPDMLSSLEISEYALDQIKISTYNSFDPLLSAAQKGSKARDQLLHGLTLEDTKQIVDEIMNTTATDLREMADGFAKYMKSSVISIIGSGEKIEAEKDRFSEIIAI